VAGVLAALAILACEPVFAQCAMCRTAVEGSGNNELAKTLNVGIIVMLLPPVGIFCSIFVVALRHRRSKEESVLRPEEDRAADL
jgi:hypothetical protein